MKLSTTSFENHGPIPTQFAFGKIDPETNVALSENRNPQFSWSDLPEGTKSLALICHDPDVPSKPDDVNQEDREVPSDLPRVDFYHWVLANLDPNLGEIEAGAFSNGVTARGKGPATAHGAVHGINDYTGWFAGDADMEGDYYGYDGPCPPFNDSIIHHYHFTLYALDVPTLDLKERFTGADLKAAMEGHILGSASVVGTYTLNPRLA